MKGKYVKPIARDFGSMPNAQGDTCANGTVATAAFSCSTGDTYDPGLARCNPTGHTATGGYCENGTSPTGCVAGYTARGYCFGPGNGV